MLIALGVVLWAVCGIVAYGSTLYDYQHQSFSYMRHPRVLCLWLGFTGPCGLLACAVTNTHWGLSFRGFTREKRWEIFDQQYNCSGHVYKTREEFDKEY